MSVARTIRFNVKSEFARNEIKRIIAVAVGRTQKAQEGTKFLRVKETYREPCTACHLRLLL